MTTTSTDAASLRTGERRTSFRLDLERIGLPVFLAVLIVTFAILPETGPSFRSILNIQNVLAYQSVTGLVALSMVIPLVAGYFDLSVAAIAGLANVTVATMISQYGQPVLLSLIVGVLVGLVAGAINALLIAGLGLDAFITTLGTYIFWAGSLALYTGGKTINGNIPLDFALWTTNKFIGIPAPFWLLIVLAFAVWFLITQTPFGRRLAAIGSNEQAAKLAGIRTKRAVAITFVLSGLLAGVAGALLTSSNGAGDATSAISYLFPALAAVFLGRTAIDPGHYNVWGTILGLFFVAVAVNGLTLMGAPASVTQMFNGAALVFSIAVATFTTRSRERKARTAQLKVLRASDRPANTSRSAAPAGNQPNQAGSAHQR